MTEETLIVKAIPLNQIHPDPQQPRRLLPPDLAEALAGGASPTDILMQLRERKRAKGVQERRAQLDALADSIAADGLMQPIRVIRDGEDAYRIEAGERRWWAHQILLARGDTRFDKIAAIVVGQEVEAPGVLRRRVAENVHRSEFTAIELAHAMAARIQEIASAEPTLASREIETRVGKENGLSDRRVRQLLALLNLPAAIQQLAQQAHLSESSLRGLVGIKDATRQMAAARRLLHPNHKSKQSGDKVITSDRRGRAKSKSSKPGMSRQVAEPADILQLVAFATKLRSRNPEKIGRELKTTLIKSESKRQAISHLREALTLALEGEVGNTVESNECSHESLSKKKMKE